MNILKTLSGTKLFPGTYVAVLKAINTDLSAENSKLKKLIRRGLIQVN